MALKRNCDTAVILGGAWNALGHARALAPHVNVVLVQPAERRNFARGTRFARTVTAPNPVSEPDAAIDCVLNIARSRRQKPVLYCCDDSWMFAAGRRQSEIRDGFHWPLSDWSLIEGILNKRKLYRLASEFGIQVPYTREYADFGTMLENLGSFPFPCVVKPETTVNYLERLPATLKLTMHHRTSVFKNRADLDRWARLMVKAALDVPVLVQEFIEGGADHLYTLTSYSDRHARMVVGSVGHKVRQFPPDAGCIVAGRLRHIDEVFDQGRRLLDGLGFHGLANTEFKYDSRDGSYRLMEINPRLGMWNSSALAAGLNLPLICYRDAKGASYGGPSFSTAADGALWVDLMVDGLNCLFRYRSAGYPAEHLGLRRWLATLGGRRISAVWRWDDPGPSLMQLYSILGDSLSRVFHGTLSVSTESREEGDAPQHGAATSFPGKAA